jgi:hypothetical protein
MKNKIAILIIKPPGFIHWRVFEEVAYSIFFALKKFGIDVLLTDDVSLNDRKYIVLGANLIKGSNINLNKDTIIYQLEREDSDEQFDKFYLDLLKNFEVWDFSKHNAESINRKYNTKIKKILPISFVPELQCISHNLKKDIDVLFIGSSSPRREKIIHDMKRMNINVIHLFGSYGLDRNNYIGRSKLLLNMHFHRPGLFEHVRIFFYLSNSCAVLSEESSHYDENIKLLNKMFIEKYENLAFKALELINDVDQLETVSKNGFIYAKNQSLEKNIKELLKY